MNVIERIKQLRDERGLSTNELALRSEITQSTLSTLLNSDQNALPRLDTLMRLCYKGFGVTLAQFFLEDETIEVLSESEREMLAAFRKLSPKQQQALIAVFTEQD